MHRHRWLRDILFAALSFVATAQAAEHRVSSASEISDVAGGAHPGDVLVMNDGVWQDQAIVFRGQGTAEKPITLRAQTPGQVILAGKSSLTIDGDYLLVSGLFLKNAQSGGDGVKLAGRHCRLTDSAVIGGSFKFFVHFFGASNRMDHCYLAGKTNDSPTLQVEVQGQANHHQIDQNHFGPRPPLGRNGGETMRVGYSWQSMNSSRTLVEHNLFDRCDGEIEIISSKSCENTYRYNTFLDCAGMLTLRNSIVAGNLQGFGPTTPSDIVIGENVAEKIAEFARCEKADLIAIATHGRGGLSRLVHGSVADALTKSARTSLFVFHPTMQGVTPETKPLAERRITAFA